MSVKKILSCPADEYLLRSKSVAVDINDPMLAALIEDLQDTLRATAHGVGLAAPQIGVLKRVFVLKRGYIKNDLEEGGILSRQAEDIIAFVNPKIISGKGLVREQEGCLSVPGAFVDIERIKAVKLRALDEKGRQFNERFKGLAARAIQQEIDHLNGVLIVDHLKKEKS
ncbi:MAG: peptide deformylase [Candidatus Omnitrophica bacterium]|nr:peptide deformylase [Candidatus Omnitrophota bacterium]MBU4479328.1 peptide deformylase [Candidatus Omnitrophota bacterium]MCG2704232.1 peptide deformylase [Candidatus Omnitrophota bacterium]